MPTFKAELVYSPLLNGVAKNLDKKGQVFADEGMSQPLPVTVNGERRDPGLLSTGPAGVCEEFSTDTAMTVWTQWPLASGAGQVSWAQRIDAVEVAQLQDAASGAVAQAAQAQQQAAAAQAAAVAAQASAAQMQALQFAAQNILTADGKLNPDVIPAGLGAGGGGGLTAGQDAQGVWIQTVNGDGTPNRLYVASPDAIASIVATQSSTDPKAASLVMRDAGGRIAVAAPMNGADAATKAYVDSAASGQASAAVAGVPVYAYWDGTQWRYNSATGVVVTAANRPANRPIIWINGPDPATVASVKLLDTDQYWTAS